MFTLSVEEQACPRVFCERKQVCKAAVGDRQAEGNRQTKRSRDRGAGRERDPKSVVSLFHHTPVYINLNIICFHFNLTSQKESLYVLDTSRYL